MAKNFIRFSHSIGEKDKSTLSVLVDLGLIVFLMESTPFLSTLHFGSATNGVSPPIRVTQIPTVVATSADIPEQATFQDTPSPKSMNTSTTDVRVPQEIQISAVSGPKALYSNLQYSHHQRLDISSMKIQYRKVAMISTNI
jgi:hypothetical protein